MGKSYTDPSDRNIWSDRSGPQGPEYTSLLYRYQVKATDLDIFLTTFDCRNTG